MIRIIFFIVNLLIVSDVLCQRSNYTYTLGFGYETIPLYIKRTDVTRWMLFPNFLVGYKLNEKTTFLGSVSIHDIRLSSYNAEKYRLYSETPNLHSYEEALEYIGEKSDPSEFNSYIFLGIESRPFNSGFFKKSEVVAQIGYRQGYTFILEHVFEEPSYPNGFEAHLSHQSSNSIGVKLGLSQKVTLFNLFFIQPKVGTYCFTNWPILQFYGSILFGVTV